MSKVSEYKRKGDFVYIITETSPLNKNNTYDVEYKIMSSFKSEADRDLVYEYVKKTMNLGKYICIANIPEVDQKFSGLTFCIMRPSEWGLETSSKLDNCGIDYHSGLKAGREE